jgi:hypothetical protein
MNFHIDNNSRFERFALSIEGLERITKMQLKRLLWCVTVMACLVVMISGCVQRAYLIVDYDVPAKTLQLQGQTVQLTVKDLRQDKFIFTPAAAAEFRGFQNRYSLAWKGQDGSRILAGEYDLENLFRVSFKKRLEQLGVMVTTDSQSYAPVFEIVLEKFKIDQRGHKWVAEATYEATLSKDSNLIARERVTGTAERVKIIGRKGADTVLSEIFSEILNRVNIMKLFEQAKLT